MKGFRRGQESADVLGDVGLDECNGFVAPHFNGRYPICAFNRHGTLPNSPYGAKC